MPEQTPDGGIVITPADMYREAHERYGRIEEALARIATDLHPLPAQVADHEQRIRRLERAVWQAAGAAGALASITTLVVSRLAS